MAQFTSNARGIYLNDDSVVVDAQALRGKIDFVFADAGWGADRAERFTDHIQTAADAGAMCIMYYKLDPESYVNSTFNPDRWPDDAHDWQMQVVDRQLMSGTKMRSVQAIIIDATMTMGRDGKTKVTDNWVRGIGQWFADKLWRRYHLPVYTYLTPDTVLAYGTSQVLPVWLANMGTVSTWTSAFLANPQWEVVSDFDNWPIPADGNRPNSMYTTHWDFWKYANTKFGVKGIATADGKTPAIPMWLYNGTRAKLFADNFATDSMIPVVTPPTPDDPPVDDGGSTDPGDGTVPEPPDDPNDPVAGIKSLFWVALAAGLDGFCHFWVQGRDK